jgi:general secretion pathway protein L
MRDLAAPLLRRASGKSQDALVLECDAGMGRPWHVIRRRGGVRMPVATIAPDAGDAAWSQAFASRRRGEKVVIALGQPFLSRRTSVPAAASANLDRLLGYEMDRLTPFAADDVLYSHRVKSRDTAAGTIQVEVSVVPKAWLRDPIERLAALSIRPAAVEALTPASEAPIGSGQADGWRVTDRWQAGPSRISLDHVDPAALARGTLVRRILTCACLALAVAVVAVPFIRQSIALATAEDRIAELRPRMELVDQLRRRIASGTEGAGQIAAARERGTAALRLLGVLTDMLPDDTYLTSLSLRRDRLTIEGRSATATRLIASMTADPNLKNPSFAAPVVRGENGADIFTIQAGFGS